MINIYNIRGFINKNKIKYSNLFKGSYQIFMGKLINSKTRFLIKNFYLFFNFAIFKI